MSKLLQDMPKVEINKDVVPIDSEVVFNRDSIVGEDVIRMLEVPAKIPAKSDVKMSVQGDYASGGTLCVTAVRGWLE